MTIGTLEPSAMDNLALDTLSMQGATRLILRSPLGQAIHVVPREECQFRRYRLKAVSRAGRAAVRLKAQRDMLDGGPGGLRIDPVQAPPDEEGGASADTVGVWAFPWVGPAHSRHLPESLARTSPGDGLHLVRCLSGVEGQYRAGGTIASSRWWSAVPDAREWALFVRAALPKADLSGLLVPEVLQLPWRSDFAPLSVSRDRLGHIFSPWRVLGTVAVVSVLATGFTAGRYFAATAQADRAQAAVEEALPGTQVAQSARRRALALSREVLDAPARGDSEAVLYALHDVDAALAAAMPTPATTPVLAEDADSGETPKPPPAPVLQSLELEGRALELTIRNAPGVDIPRLVRALEETPHWSGVSATSAGRDTVRLSGQVSLPDVGEQP